MISPVRSSITVLSFRRFQSGLANTMRGCRKFRQRGSDFDNVFIKFDEGRNGPNTTFSGPSTAPQRNAI